MTAALLAGLLVVALGCATRPHPPSRVLGTVGADGAVGDGNAPSGRAPSRWPSFAAARRAHSQPSDADVARWCDDIARGTRSGLSLGGAVLDASRPDHSPAVDRLVLQLSRGVPLERAAAHDVHHDAAVGLAFTVLRACAQHGGPASEPLGRAAAVLRGRAHDDGERKVQSAQARLSALVMTILPMAMLVLLVVTSHAVRSFASGGPGVLLIGSGITLNLAGWRWMRSIIERRVV